MPIYFEANLDGSIELANQFTDFNPKALVSNYLATDGWEIVSSSRTPMLEISLRKDNEQQTFIIHASKVHNQEEGRNPEEKRIQISSNTSATLFNYPVNRSPIGLFLGVYRRDVYEDTILCAWPLDAIPSAGSTDSIRVKIHVLADALANGISTWINTSDKIICAFRPEFLHTYINNRNGIHSGEIDVTELIGGENQTELRLEEAFETGDIDLNDIVSLPSLSRITKTQFDNQQEQFEEKGREGEEKLNAYFLQQQNEGRITEYEWTSNIYPYYPYDFKFVENGQQIYVDAKSTTGGFSRQLFISGNELKMIFHYDNYYIYRLYLDENNETKARKSRSMKDYVHEIFHSFQSLPEGVNVKNLSINPTELNFELEELDL